MIIKTIEEELDADQNRQQFEIIKLTSYYVDRNTR